VCTEEGRGEILDKITREVDSNRLADNERARFNLLYQAYKLLVLSLSGHDSNRLADNERARYPTH
jgi:hypothetical protein